MYRKRAYKRIIPIILLFCHLIDMICFSNVPSNNVWVRYEKELYGSAIYAMELNSGLVLFEKNPDKKMFPASLTKIMTVVVVLDNVSNLDEKLQFSYNAVTRDIDRNSTTIGASAGDVLSVIECLYCVLLPSANDAANALAEYVAGNINDFTLLMNEKAKRLGMLNTHFSNPTGLHNENNYTTARDMALLLNYAMTKDAFRQIIKTTTFKHSPIRKYRDPDNSNNTVLNTNSALLAGTSNYYKYTIGGKTGYTKDAGYTLAACAAKNGMEMLVVDLGCKKNDERFDDFKKICNFYFDHYKSYNIKELEPRFRDGYTDMTAEGVTLVRALRITVSDKASITIPKNVNIRDVDINISYIVEIDRDNNAIGTVKCYYDHESVGYCSLLGLPPEEVEDIHTAYLNISQQEGNRSVKVSDKSNRYINTDKPIYVDQNGVLTISRPVATFIEILLMLIIIVLLVLFFRSKYFIIIKETVSHRLWIIRRKHR